MRNKSKRKFLKSIGSAGILFAGANLPVWAINFSANADQAINDVIRIRVIIFICL